jgi:large subunit ribosomal protein L17
VHLGDHGLVKRLFEEISPRFEDRDSGFTRIFMLGSRLGDGAQMAVLEMTVKGEVKKKKTKSAAKTAAGSPAKETGKSKAKAKEKEKSRKKKETAKDRESDSAEKKPTSKKKSG